MNINSTSRPKLVSRSKKTSLSFREKENHWSAKVSCIGFLFETPFRASILFFTVIYEYSLLLKKKDECVNSLHWFGNLSLFERIQQGYDLNPGILVRFGTSANHRIPFLNCTCCAARSFAGGCLNGVFQNPHHQSQAQEENFYRREWASYQCSSELRKL